VLGEPRRKGWGVLNQERRDLGFERKSAGYLELENFMLHNSYGKQKQRAKSNQARGGKEIPIPSPTPTKNRACMLHHNSISKAMGSTRIVMFSGIVELTYMKSRKKFCSG